MIRRRRLGPARRSGPVNNLWHTSLGGGLLVAVATGGSAAVALATQGTSPATGVAQTGAAGSPSMSAVAGAPSQADGDAVDAIYRRDCAVCHGEEGDGTPRGPDLAGSGSALVDYVLRTGRMPIDDPDEDLARSDPAYDEATTRGLVDYVVGLQDGAVGDGPPIPDVDPEQGDVAVGGEVWRRQCAACHAWSGTGGAMLDRSAPSVHEATPLELSEAVRSGPVEMPRFGADVVSSHELDSVAAFVDQELAQAEDSGGWDLGHIGPVAEGGIAVVVGVGLLMVVARVIGGGKEHR